MFACSMSRLYEKSLRINGSYESIWFRRNKHTMKEILARILIFFFEINVNISTGIKKYARVSEIHIWKKSLLSIERAACRTLIYDPQHAQS